MADSRQMRLPATHDYDEETLWLVSWKHGISIQAVRRYAAMGLDIERMSHDEMWRAWVRVTTTQQPPGGDSCAET